MVILSRFSEAYFSKTQVLLVLHGFLTVAGGFFPAMAQECS